MSDLDPLDDDSPFPDDPPRGLAWRIYDAAVLSKPGSALVLLVTLLLAIFLARHARDYRMDASPDSIVMEDDPDLRFYDDTRLLFGSDEFVVVVVQAPDMDDLLSDEKLRMLDALSADLQKVHNVESTLSILDAPLFHSPDIPPFRLASGYNTLRKNVLEAGADPNLSPDAAAAREKTRELAKAELLESPLLSDYLLASDELGVTTAILVNFDPDLEFLKIDQRRAELRAKERAGTLSPEERAELREAQESWETHHLAYSDSRMRSVAEIREVMARWERETPAIGPLEQGGITLVIADMVSFIRGDLVDFSLAALAFMLVALVVVFRSPSRVILPLAACALTALATVGWLGWTKWITTVVTSNFASLLLILTMSCAIHIAERHRELTVAHPGRSRRAVALAAVRSMFAPCAYMVLTTMVGFGSLWLSGIAPVMQFGAIMTIGLGISFVVCFVFYPAALVLFPAGRASEREGAFGLAAFERRTSVVGCSRFVERRPWIVGGVAALVFAAFVPGLFKLSVEARFIDYFREDTGISRSLRLIDERMGGTNPLEIVLDAPAEGEPGHHAEYWLQPDGLARLKRVHDFVDELPETGKTLSMESIRRVLQRVNGGREVQPAFMKVALGAIPENLRRLIIDPYLTADRQQARITIRVRESDATIRQTALRKTIEDFLRDEGMTAGGNARVTGYYVLYNNMVNSLYDSQVRTMGITVAVVWLMFLVLFRSARIATIVTIPNLYPVAIILGAMGWAGVPLDMMTIMIAAVAYGIAVDDTIQYVHRFRREFEIDRDYEAAMRRCHDTVGRAILYASTTLVAGFSILMLSNFVPTVRFGMFTALAMLVALAAELFLTPLLLVKFRPFGPPGASASPPAAS